MHVLHLIKKFNFGGAENHVRDLANVMDGKGNKVFIISKRGMQNNLLNAGVKFIPLRMADFLILINVLFVVYIIKKYKIQVIHAHQRLPVLIGTFAAKIAGIPIVVTVHGQTQYDLRSGFSKRLPDKFIYVRQSSLESSIGFGIPKSKTAFIQNGVSISKLQRNRDYYSICYISRIDKRHFSVISMITNKVIVPLFNEYPELKFNIIGAGNFLGDIRKEAEIINNKLNRKVIIVHGYVADVKEIIQKSGLTLGVGRVAIESLACGIPLLSVNQKYLGRLVTMENYMFYKLNNFVSIGSESPDEQGLIRSFREYLSDISNCQKETVLLQKKIDEDLNIFKIVRTITDLYQETIDHKSEG
jgi:glycosyltransferase involved in cell wall biosynthesis